MAETSGFTVEMNRSIGYGILIPGDDFAEKLAFTAEELEAPFLETPILVVKTAKAPVSRTAGPKIVNMECPICGMKIRAREGSNVLCGDCNTAFELANKPADEPTLAPAT